LKPRKPEHRLINSLALYARTNEYGFLETPYRKVANGRVTDDIEFCRRSEKASTSSAQANAGDRQERASCSTSWCPAASQRIHDGDCRPRRDMDVAPSQIVSVPLR